MIYFVLERGHAAGTYLSQDFDDTQDLQKAAVVAVRFENGQVIIARVMANFGSERLADLDDDWKMKTVSFELS